MFDRPGVLSGWVNDDSVSALRQHRRNSEPDRSFALLDDGYQRMAFSLSEREVFNLGRIEMDAVRGNHLSGTAGIRLHSEDRRTGRPRACQEHTGEHRS